VLVDVGCQEAATSAPGAISRKRCIPPSARMSPGAVVYQELTNGLYLGEGAVNGM
jgi:hypothetical protein